MDYEGPHPEDGEERRLSYRRDDDAIVHQIYKHVYPLQERLVKVETSLDFQRNNLDEVKRSISDLDLKLTKRIDDTSHQLLVAIADGRAAAKLQLEEHAADEQRKYDQIYSLNQMVSAQISQAKYGFLGVGGTIAIIWSIIELGVKLNWFH
jgi:hypothetical protein